MRIIIALFLACISITVLAQPFTKVTVNGVVGAAQENVTNAIKNLPPQASQMRVEQAINAALQPYGYFEAKITIKVNDTNQATIYIDPGSPVILTKLDLVIVGEGAATKLFKELLTKLPLHEKQTFSVPDYEQAQHLIVNAAYQYGYLSARFVVKKVTINPEKNSAEISLHFDTGPRYKFASVHFSPSPFKVEFLQRFLTFKSGDYYNNDKIEELRQQLLNSSYFKKVLVTPQLADLQEVNIPVDIKLKMKKKYQYLFGLGYGTDTGPRALVGLENRYLTDDGQYYTIKLQPSVSQSAFEANYIIPGQNPLTERYTFSAASLWQNYVYGTSNAQKLAASYTTNWHGWQQTVSLAAQRERTELLDQSPFTAFMLLPSITWDKLSSNDPIRPSRGYHISVSVTGTPGITATTQFLQAQISYKSIMPVFEVNRFLLRADLGYTVISGLNTLPLSFQFFAGGAQSVRGYAFNSIGPGNSMLVGSAEYRQHITGDWYLAAFIDAGNVSNSLKDPLKKGVGAGVVWASAIGVLELTLAKALNSPGEPYSLQFSMGADL